MTDPKDNHAVQFWDRGIRGRLEESTLSPGQAAKRNLSAYFTLIDGMLPAVHQATAEALVRHLMTRRDELATPYTIIASWHDLIDTVSGYQPNSRVPIAHSDLYQPDQLSQRYALIDAADRCIAAYDAAPEPYLPELVRAYFRITPEAS